MSSPSLPAVVSPQAPRLLDRVRQVAQSRFGKEGPAD
jgi:hypothetical protein